jgi:GH35 family endo-1,4-beta-xylanase
MKKQGTAWSCAIDLFGEKHLMLVCKILCRGLVACGVVWLAAGEARGQTTVNAASLPYQSFLSFPGAGSDSGTSAVLTQNGYVGTYVTLAQSGAVTFTASASGTASNGIDPDMTFSIADYSHSFDVTPGSTNNYTYTTPVLPAGTYFVRTQLDNNKVSLVGGNPVTATPTLTIGSLTVSGNAGVNTTAPLLPTDPNYVTNYLNPLSQPALDAANTYINNFRQGPATVATGYAPGTQVTVKMVRNAFNFGGTVSGVSVGDSKDMLSVTNPAITTEAGQFQSFINQYFNTIVPSNAGKWSSNEATQGNVSMQLVDEQLAYAKSHNLSVRMHNLLWGQQQQPTFANTLVNTALGGGSGAATAKTTLSNDITSRIGYYVSGTSSSNSGITHYGTGDPRAADYMQVDVLNEALHSPTYWNVYGASGMAKIFNQVLTAGAAAGNPNLKAMTNEFNVLQFSPATLTAPANLSSSNPNAIASGNDPYANYYRNEVEAINNAGFAAPNNFQHNVVNEIGMELYSDVNATGANTLSTTTMQAALQNLAVEGLPVSMNEFGMNSATNSQTLGPAALNNAMRMMYGNPQADTFMIWGWWDTHGNTPPAQLIVTNPGANGYTLTALGQQWVSLMNAFTTPTQTLTVGADGTIDFSGFYGDYTVTINGVNYDLDLQKGTTFYVVPEPAAGSLAVLAGVLVSCGRFFAKPKPRVSDSVKKLVKFEK